MQRQSKPRRESFFEVTGHMCSKPGSCQSLLSTWVANAEKSIKIQVYRMNVGFLAELEGPLRRGVSIRMVLDRKVDNNGKGQPRPQFWRTLSAMIARYPGQIGVKFDGIKSLSHQKSLLIDDKFLITGTYNFSNSPQLNSMLVFDNTAPETSQNERKVVEQHIVRFDDVWRHGEAVPALSHVKQRMVQYNPPKSSSFVPFKPGSCFFPEGKKVCSDALVMFVNSARESLLVSTPHFSEPVLIKAVLDAANRGVRVRILHGATNVDTIRSRDSASKLWQIPPSPTFEMRVHQMNHNKYMVVDSKRLAVGSYNFTYLGRTSRENVVFVTDERVANQFAKEFCRLFNDPDSQPAVL